MSDWIENDLERLRQTDADYTLDIEQAEIEHEQEQGSGVPDVVCVVGTDGTFPTVANRFYKVIPQTVLGTETEGQVGLLTALPGHFYAYNLGTTIPTANVSRVVCSFVRYRWVFIF